MHKASAVMYTIANIFSWIIAAICVVGIVLSIIAMTGTAPDLAAQGFGVSYLVACIFVFIVTIITIWMVRMAKAKGTSHGWDILFLVLGFLCGNIFYFLGGLFGLIAKN